PHPSTAASLRDLWAGAGGEPALVVAESTMPAGEIELIAGDAGPGRTLLGGCAAARPGPEGWRAGKVLDDLPDVLLGAGRVEDTQPDGVAAGQAGGGDQRGAAAFQVIGKCLAAAFGFGLIAAGPFPAEADDPQRRRCHQGEPRLAADQGLGEFRQL